MCGIIGIASTKHVSDNIIEALKRLEYRGYDSAGLSTIDNGEINEKKCSGRVNNLEKILFENPLKGNLGIGHVRWATHTAFLMKSMLIHTHQRLYLLCIME